MKSRRGWLYAAMVAVLIFSGFYWYHLRHVVENTTMTWYSNNPIEKSRAKALSVKLNGHAQTTPITPLRGSIAGAEWYMPITVNTAVSYALHDGQGRWVEKSHQYNLSNAPTDPVGALTAAPNGSGLAWVFNGQIYWLHAGGALTRVPHAHSPNLTNQGLEYVVSASTTHQISSPYPTRFESYDTPTSPNPFVDNGQQFIFDKHGVVNTLSLATGAINELFAVNPNHWSRLFATISFAHGTAVLFTRQIPVPAYLLVIATPQRVYWYRWPAAITPELGATASGTLVIGGIEPSLMAFGQGSLYSLSQSAALFSSGPQGVVFSNGSNGFLKLTRVTF